MPALHDAVKGGSLDAVRAAIDGDQSELNKHNEEGDTPLVIAVREHSVKIAELLLQRGANVNHPVQQTGSNAGYTPLHFAARAGEVDGIKLLAKYEADVDRLAEDGWTALHTAAFAGKSQAVKALVEAGADVNTMNKAGVPAIVFTANHGRTSDTRLLIEHGAGLDFADGNGDSLLHHTFHFQMSKLFEGEYDVPEIQLDVAVNLAIHSAPVERKNIEGHLATYWIGDDMPSLQDVLAILAHNAVAFRRAPNTWNYMTVLGAPVEHYVGMGLELKHAVDLYERVHKVDEERKAAKKRREEERPAGGCPVMRGGKKKKKGAEAEAAKAAGEDPSGGQCPFFQKKDGDAAPVAAAAAPAAEPAMPGGHPAKMSADEARKAMADAKGGDPSGGQCPFFQKKPAAAEGAPVAAPAAARPAPTVLSLLVDNHTTVLLVSLAFVLGMLFEQRFGRGVVVA